jgi:hypothetical protein
MKYSTETEKIEERVMRVQQQKKALTSKYKFQIPYFVTNEWPNK